MEVIRKGRCDSFNFNWSSQKTKPSKPNQTYKTKPKIQNQIYMTKPNLHNQTFKSHKLKCMNKIYKSNPYNSAKTGQGLGCPELGTSQPQLISTFSDFFFINIYKYKYQTWHFQNQLISKSYPSWTL